MIINKARTRNNKAGKTKTPKIEVPELETDKVDNLPKKTQSKYDSLKDKEIVDIELFRAPIQSVLKTILEVATPGLKQLEKKLGYDNLYHLGMIITLKNDRKYIVEKNQNILIIGQKSYPNAEKLKVPVKAGITLKSMFNKTLSMMGSSKFYGYNFENNNCQTFIKSLLKSQSLLNPQANKFIEQDIPTLVENLPDRVKDIANLTTDIAGVLDRLQQQLL